MEILFNLGILLKIDNLRECMLHVKDFILHIDYFIFLIDYFHAPFVFSNIFYRTKPIILYTKLIESCKVHKVL